MAKTNRKKKDHDQQPTPKMDSKLVPVIKTSDKHGDLTQPDKKIFEPYAGEYHLIEIDKDGNEIPGTDFSIGERTFYKTYNKLIGKTFIVKKNPRK